MNKRDGKVNLGARIRRMPTISTKKKYYMIRLNIPGHYSFDSLDVSIAENDIRKVLQFVNAIK